MCTLVLYRRNISKSLKGTYLSVYDSKLMSVSDGTLPPSRHVLVKVLYNR